MKKIPTLLLGLAAGVAGFGIDPARALEPGFFYFGSNRVLSVYDGLSGLLTGANGFRLAGSADESRLGSALSAAGDINGDGYGDIVVGAPFFNSPSFREGRAYVLFGPGPALPSQQPTFLNGTNGFQVTGLAADDQLGASVAGLGDINGDGRADVAFGAPQADPSGRTGAGAAYVVFGATNFTLNVSLAGLNGTNGFTLAGEAAGFQCASALAPAGDVNGDGRADFLVGAEKATIGGQTNIGRVYLVYGATNYPSSLDLGALNGTNGMLLTGESASDSAGHALAALCDYNGDGLDDILVGAHTAPDFFSAGRAYAIFGSTNRTASLSLAALNGTNGFRIDGDGLFGNCGYAVAASDVNGDGLFDAAVSAHNLNEVYVLFGRADPPASLSVTNLNGTNGFAVAYTNAEFGFGSALAGAARLNVDGYGDLLCGAPTFTADGRASAGEIFAIFGRDVFPRELDPESLNGTNGFRLKGGQALAEAGGALASMSDMNSDTFDELLIGERLFDYSIPGTNVVSTNAGAAYVVSPPGVAELVLYHPELIATGVSSGLYSVTWAGQTGVTYTVYTNGSLAGTSWGEATNLVSGSATTTVERAAGSAPAVFYRISARR
ncbi:MAG TPA: integrin alpha [Kiritimatiellia bacterium]|nr:integrin alpha [Kiritimatiellia bacterium]HRZ11113.1 integrin alpha [Kiritimatiellia bacterium]HSA19515.1 integrin alpha [Kiritimatiellia bacterium]